MIEFRGAKKNYKNINMDLSLTLNKGEIVLLVGKNAAGKTSSLKLLLGVNDLDYGEIEIDGERINAKSKEKIGLVLQDSFFPDDFTARQIGHVIKSFDEYLFYSYLDEFELEANHKLKTYSLGMLAKLKIISAICHKPKLLIPDEPTLGLDLLARDDIIKLIRDIMNDDMTIIIASHLTNEFDELCDRVVFIYQGQVLASYDMDFVDSSLALIKADKNAQKDLDKSDILSVDIGDYSASYLVKNRQKYMDGKFILEKASLDDLVRAIYRRKDK